MQTQNTSVSRFDANVLKLEQLATAVGSMFPRLTTATENVRQDTAVLWPVQRRYSAETSYISTIESRRIPRQSEWR